ncbi:hypothetical protein [Anoxybacillus sp. MB8]|uniref:hypothetical protein n=1 Tax=Anoxybacillus sp. MB8 TaxID=2496850 RepID=UPI0013D80778|nr:hypothetical protein [Anoxybacillus sp. MB8]
MLYLFFAFFFLTLIPVYIRLSFGWTKKGVAFLLIFAFLLSIFGMIVVKQFPLWQAALFLLLLVIASTYLLEQKLGHLFYARIHEHDLIVVNDVEDEQNEEPIFMIKEVVEEKQEEERDPQQEQTEEMEFEWLESNGPEEVEQHVSVEPLRNNEYDHIIESLAEMDDVIEPLHIVDNDGTDVNNEHHEMDDERWVNLLAEENDELVETEENELLKMDELVVVDEMTDRFVDEKNEVETVIEDDGIVDEKQNEMEMIPVIGGDAIGEKQQDEAESIPIVEKAIVYVDEEPSAYSETIAIEKGDEAIRMLPKPFMKNLLASLYTMRPLLSDEEYEQLIYKHLHPRLHEQDYYAFANVLMEHYVASKQYEKLYDVAKQLYGQYESYPIIQQQLAHMIHYAEQKMGWKK